MQRIKSRRKEFLRKVKGQVHKCLAVAYAVCFSALAFSMPVFASNPVENARKIVVGDWLQPLIYIACGAFGILLAFKRRFTELLAFAGVVVAATLLVVYPELLVNFIGSVLQKIF